MTTFTAVQYFLQHSVLAESPVGRGSGESCEALVPCISILPRLHYTVHHCALHLTPRLSVMEETIAKLEALLSKLERSGQEENVAKVKD